MTDQSNEERRGGKPEWVRFYASDWLAGTRGLTPAETGVYIVLCCLIFESGEPVPEDYGRIGRLCGARAGVTARLVRTLIDLGKVEKTGRSLIIRRAVTEHFSAQKRVSQNREAAKVRWEKTSTKSTDAPMRAQYGRNAGGLKAIARIDDDDDLARAHTRARGTDPSDDDIPFDLVDPILDTIAQITGVDLSRENNPEGTLDGWRKLEISDEEIIETIRAVRMKKGDDDPPERLAYFTKALHTRQRLKRRPNLKPVTGGKPSDKRSGVSAKDRQAERDLEEALELARRLDGERRASEGGDR